MITIAKGNFERTVRVVKLPRVETMGLIVECKWAGAKNPDEKRREFAGFMSPSEMRQLANYLLWCANESA